MLKAFKHKIHERLVRYLTARVRKYEPFSVANPDILRATLKPGDVLLVEGNQRFSTAVKYLTQSTWSHAAIYVGDAITTLDQAKHQSALIEAELQTGVIAVPLTKYEGFNTRICRPVGITAEDLAAVVQFMIDSIGMEYDLKNVIDLARFLIPTPPVPVRWRRRMLALGSGDPTRVICSTRIAQAFQSVRFPILPIIEKHLSFSSKKHHYTTTEILHIRHHSLFTPRDFDLSPYFAVVKPTIETGFNYKQAVWDTH